MPQLPALRQSKLPVTVPSPSSAKLAKQLVAAMAAIHRRGWCEGTGGNFSCVLQRQPLQLLMAPSGVDKGSVSPEQLIVVDERGEVLRGSGRASAETELHLALVQTCGAGAVLHTHSQAGTLLSQHYAPHGAGMAQLSLQDLEMLKGLEGVSSHTCQGGYPRTGQRPGSASPALSSRAPPGGRPLRPADCGPRALRLGEGSGNGTPPPGDSGIPAGTALAPTAAARQLAPRTPRLQRHGLRWVLLDIEGTTCPVSFVAGELFPYAAEQMGPCCWPGKGDLEVQALVAAVETAWEQDPLILAMAGPGPAPEGS